MISFYKAPIQVVVSICKQERTAIRSADAYCASRVNIPAPMIEPTTASIAVRAWKVDWCCAEEASDGMSIVQVLIIAKEKEISLLPDAMMYMTYAVA